MKKKVCLGMILSLIGGFSLGVHQVEAQEKNRVETSLTEQLPPVQSEETQSIQPKNLKANQLIALPKEEFEKVVQLQENFKKVYDHFPTGNKFSEVPVLENGVYKLGKLKVEQEESIARQINFYRMLARLNEIPYNQAAGELAQYGAVGMAAVRQQTHGLNKLDKPEDMPEEFWLKAGQSAASSNIHSSVSERELYSHANDFMVDYGKGNDSAGHRRNILSLTATKLGVGYAQSPGEISSTTSNFYTTLYTETSYASFATYSKDFVTQWPTEGVFPYDMYNTNNPYLDQNRFGEKYERNMRWSVLFNQKGYDLVEQDIKVVLTDETTGEKTEIINDDQGGEVTIKQDYKPGYVTSGGYSSVVFRPNNSYEIKKDTLYNVKISGIKRDGKLINYEYNTKLVGMYDNYQEEVPLSTIELNLSKTKLTIGENVLLNAKISPENATKQQLEWSSLDSKIATIDNQGKVKAVAKGKTTITATSTDSPNISASCEIEVTPNEQPLQDWFEDYYFAKMVGYNLNLLPTDPVDKKTLMSLKTLDLRYWQKISNLTGTFNRTLGYSPIGDNNTITDFDGIELLTGVEELILPYLNEDIRSIKNYQSLSQLPKLKSLGVSDLNFTIGDSMFDLSKLVSLSVDHLVEEDIPYLEEMSNLEVIKQYDDRGYGEIENSVILSLAKSEKLKAIENFYLPTESIDALKGIPNLEKLAVSISNFEDLTHLYKLTNIKNFSIIDFPINSESLKLLEKFSNLSELSGTLDDDFGSENSGFSKLTHLTKLEIYGKEAPNLESLAQLKNLKALRIDVYSRSIEDLSFLKKLTNLDKLELSSISSEVDFSILSQLSNLKQLSIEGGMVEKSVDLSSLGTLKKLRELNVKGFYFGQFTSLPQNHTFLYELPDLERLDLEFTGFDDFEAIRPMKNLKYFNYGYSNLSEDSVLEYFKDSRGVFLRPGYDSEKEKDYPNIHFLH